MAKYRKIDPVIWNDKKFNSLSVPGKLAFIFILTHPHMTSVGAMRSSLIGLSAELFGVSEKAFREAFDKGMLKADEDACFIWAPKFLKYNHPESPNVVKAWPNALDLLPECGMKDELIIHLKGFLEGLHEGFIEGFLKAFGKPLPIQEQEQEQDKIFLPETTIPANGIPYQKIVDLYHSILTDLPRVRVLSEARKKQIKARWNSKYVTKGGIESNCLEFWEIFLNYISESNFLMGRVDPKPGHERWNADLEWITKEANFLKIFEGKYHKDG